MQSLNLWPSAVSLTFGGGGVGAWLSDEFCTSCHLGKGLTKV